MSYLITKPARDRGLNATNLQLAGPSVLRPRFAILRGVRYFFTRRLPREARLLLIESGSRNLLEGLISGIRDTWGSSVRVDLVTCFGGMPRGFSPETTRVYRIADYRGREGRRRLLRELAAGRYSILGMICSGEPIMTKWKWLLAARVPGKIFILNENCDYFWVDWAHWDVMRHFILFRMGLAGAGAVRTLVRFFMFPFALLYLLLYAAIVHFRRALRRGY